MGESKLLGALAALTLAVAVTAQGPVYRERWAYMQLERLRDAVWSELAGRDATVRRAVAELLADPAPPSPFHPAARALAFLRGVEADDAFVLRTMIGVYLLPEIVDPVGRNEVCQQLNATLFIPYTVAQPGALEFDVVVRDPAGERKFEKTLAKDTDVADLRRARPEVRVSCDGLGDGSYELEVVTRVAGQEPRPTDWRPRLTFHVRRGYQQRSEGAMNAARELSDGLEPAARSMLLGLAAEVSRAYNGIAFSGQSRALLDLERLEGALDNVAAGQHVLAGLSGDVPIMLPVGERPIRCVLRIDPKHHPASTAEPRPLVVFAGGLPGFDVMASRPSSPASQGPLALAASMPDFGVGEPWHVAFLESPGNGRVYAKDLPAAVAALRAALPTGDRPVILICEREAAAVAGLALTELQAEVAGLVLIGAGAMTAAVIDGLGELPVRVAPLHGYPSSASLQRVLDYVAARTAAGRWNGDVRGFDGVVQPPAWLFGPRRLAAPIAAFVRELAAGG